ncbi:hypothetical protein AB0M80_05665 [Amycolatopsis sp. NPDC051045]|uniref:hypothetical protein n=1 Tax=Amycolatopsis sp. NPDC051045 TaxID=3156922 RepID=UPI00342D4AC1
MSYRSEKAEIARLDKESEARRAREDREQRFEQRLELARLQLASTRQDKAEAKADRKETQERWGARFTAVRTWAGAHIVDLLIYPLMVFSAAIAVPSAAHWGAAHLGETGALLPILSEWGMVAFSIAVHVSRVRTPDRPVWALQTGTWVFAAIGFVIAVLRGATTPEGGGWDLGFVMGLVSIAGVAAHQLVSAAPRRSPAEQAMQKLARQELAEQKAELATRKVAAARVEKARRAAIAHAVAEIDTDGTARLVFAPGRYRLRRGKLHPAAVAGLPVDPAADGEIGGTVADEAAAYLAGLRFRRLADPGGQQTTPSGEGEGPGGVATLDPTQAGGTAAIADEGDTDGSGEPGTGRAVPARRKPAGRRSARATIPEPKRRTFEELTAEFDAAVANPPAGFDPTNAESIRRTLKCGKAPATKLRNQFIADRPTGGSD